MTVRLSSLAILAGLVATPGANLHAQSNPWYIPPQAPAPAQVQPGSPVQQGAPQHVPQVYTQTPQYGFGAGYVVQQQAPGTFVVPQTSGLPQNTALGQGYAYQPATTGTVSSAPYIASAPSYATATQGGAIMYQAAPAMPSPQYAAPPQAALQQSAPLNIAPQQQPSAPQVYYAYQPQGQVLGNYPPLGGDPTVRPQQPVQQNPQPQQVAPTAPVMAPAWGAASALQYPGFAGPTTLSPGFGAYPGLSPMYPAPYGASPYLGLPFY